MSAQLRATVAGAAATVLVALSLLPLMRTAGWLVPAAAAVGAVALAGLLMRAARVPMVAHPVVEAAVLLTVLVWMFVPEVAAAGVLPGPVALADLRALVRDGLDVTATTPPPVPVVPGLAAVAAGGLGLVAVAVDVVGVTLRRPGLAGLPLLAVYAVPVLLLPGGALWWLLPLGAAGWLALLAAQERDGVAGWGRVLVEPRTSGAAPGGAPAPPRPARQAGPRAHRREVPRPRLAALGRTGRRLGLAALVAALAVPAVLPGLDEPMLARGGARSGGGEAAAGGPVTLDPLVSMRRDLVANGDVELLRYRLAGARSAGDGQYLRLSVLTSFDGTTWSPPEMAPSRDALVGGGTAAGPGGLEGVVYEVSVGDLDNRQLALPEPPLAASVYGPWYRDPETEVVFSPSDSTRGLTYFAAVPGRRPSPAGLRAATAGPGPELDGDLRLPEALPASVARLARQVTDAATTPYDRALALQRWFTDGRFTYSTTAVSDDAPSYLEQFLAEKVGYCEQFAGAMAVMARVVGVPARVVVGFTGGSRGADGWWHVTAQDAHAWPELWFAGQGWVRFEPTPSSGGQAISAPGYAPEAAEPGASPSASASATAGVGDPETRQGRRDSGATAGALPGGGAGPQGGWRLPGATGRLLLAAVLLGLAGSLVPAVLRLRSRRRRLRAGDDAEGAWAEVHATVEDLGLVWSAADTPRRAAQRLARLAGLAAGQAAALDRLAATTERARYAPPAQAPGGRRAGGGTAGAGTAVTDLAADVAVVRRGLAGAVPPRTRLAAWWMPRSVLRRR